MSRTIGTVHDLRTGITDLEGGVPSGIEALRQRIVQALYLRAGEWFLRRDRGLNRGVVIGHQISASLAREALDEVIRIEGGSEIRAITNSHVQVDGSNRILNYSVHLETIWGGMDLTNVGIES